MSNSPAELKAIKAKDLHAHYAFAQAISLYQQAIILAEQQGDADKVAQYRRDLGDVYDDAADHDQAQVCYEQALSHYLASEGDDSSNVVDLRNRLGLALEGQGEFDQAITMYQRALATNIRRYGEDQVFKI